MKKKKIFRSILMIILFILILYLFYDLISSYKKQNTNHSDSSDNCPFSISKIILYSSASGENKNTNFQQNNWILDIFQYSDIAIYLNNGDHELKADNTIQKLSIENVMISNPNLGSPSLYYLDSLNFGTPNIPKDYLIEDTLEFTILNDKNMDTNLQYNTPIFFTDCSNPITLKYINYPVKSNYEITSNEPIFFNGKLLNLAEISLKDLEATIKFDIHITANNNEEYYYSFNLPLELKNNKNNILEGNILVEKSFKNSNFLKK